MLSGKVTYYSVFMFRYSFKCFNCLHCFQDNNSPDDKIRIQLISLPMYGMLTMTESSQINEELSEFSSFTMEDINRQRIR